MRPIEKTRTAAQVLVDQLILNGVTHVSCVPGESYLAALDAFYDRALTVTVCRQEGGAAMMAEAVGKATGAPGICFVTRGPGATNASAGIHIAQQDSTPMIMFVGQVTRDVKDREALQELDLRAVFGTMTKWTAEIDDPARVPEIVSRAFYTATSGRPGPVVIGLPEDMLVERTAAPNAPAFAPVETSPGPPEMKKLAALLGHAQRPLAMLGGSRWSGEACAAIARFAERFTLPVATSYRRLPLFDPLHPCYAGDLGIGPNPKLVARVREADLLLIIRWRRRLLTWAPPPAFQGRRAGRFDRRAPAAVPLAGHERLGVPGACLGRTRRPCSCPPSRTTTSWTWASPPTFGAPKPGTSIA